MPPRQDDYQITLDTFHGPMDLLLYLIRRAEVDINDIPIATITDQYLGFLKQIDRIDIDLAGEFLVMAATLIEIKSKVLMPAGTGDDDDSPDGESAGARDAADPRYELVQQLLAYQKYRLAADELEQRRAEFARRFAARPARAQREIGEAHAAAEAEPIELELDDLHVLDLSDTYERIMASIDFTRMGDHHVEIDDTPLELHQEDLVDRLGRAPQRRMTLQEIFDGRSIGQRVGLFLATLELVRTRRVIVEQEEISDPVTLVLTDESGDDVNAPNDETTQR